MLARAHDSAASHRPVERAVRSVARGKRLVLAVSGGRDSMAMLHAAARVARSSVAVVATFDHGTGRAATRAAALVASQSAALGFPVVVGHAARSVSTEAEWRAMRLEFLGDVARQTGAVVATAHTRDDQVETVLMRVLRDAGARGLAGLFAPGQFERPVLELSREELAQYAGAVGAKWIEDPTNVSARHLRNRVRRDLLPALARVRPGFEREVLSLARQAADWRGVLEAVVTEAVQLETRHGGVAVKAESLAGLSGADLAVLWPAIAARAGLRTDWRGTERVADFIRTGRVGARIPVSGGWEISRTRNAFELRAPRVPAGGESELRHGLEFDLWSFTSTPGLRLGPDAWTAILPGGVPHTVRRWRAGDRMRADADAPRRVKRFLSDAKVGGALRARWPVVLAGDEIVWIPGIRRGNASTERPGRPGVLFRCELNDR